MTYQRKQPIREFKGQTPSAKLRQHGTAVKRDGSLRKPLRRKPLFILSILVLFVICVVVFVGVVIGFKKVQTFNSFSSEYAAVFIDNGQVYFGKVTNPKGTYVILTDVYYFSRSAGDNSNDSDISLIKLGSEVHGPSDKMQILRDHILFIEELEPNSRVVEAIREHKKDND